jgi:hypothetical protein
MTKRRTPGSVVMPFALWGLVGAAGLCAALLLPHLPGWLVLLAPVVAFFVSGALGGRSLGAGVGGGHAGDGAGERARADVVLRPDLAVAFGAGADTGFALAPRHGLSVLGAAVLWFAIGGALAGVMVGAVVASGVGGRSAAAVVVIGLAVDLAFTIGGAGVARALGRSGL